VFPNRAGGPREGDTQIAGATYRGKRETWTETWHDKGPYGPGWYNDDFYAPSNAGGGIPNNVPGYNYLVSTSKPGDWFYPGRNPGESFLHFLGRSILNTTANPSFQNAMAIGGPGSNFGGALNQNLTLEETFSLTPKIIKQMGSRGWDSGTINDTIQSPTATSPATNKATGGSATAYFNSDGSYVVRDNTTGTIIQISNRNDPNWVPDPIIQNPPPKP
jgi:hypothetical protein